MRRTTREALAWAFVGIPTVILMWVIVALVALTISGCGHAPKCPVENGGIVFDDRIPNQDFEACTEFQRAFEIGSKAFPLPHAPYGWRISVSPKPIVNLMGGLDMGLTYPDAALIQVVYNDKYNACIGALFHEMAHAHRAPAVPWMNELRHDNWEPVYARIIELARECEARR